MGAKLGSNGGILIVSAIITLLINLFYRPDIITDPRPDGKIQLIVEAQIPEDGLYQCYYELEDPTAQFPFNDNNSIRLELPGSKEWREITFDLPYDRLKRIRLDVGDRENITTNIKKIYFKGKHFVQLPILEYFTNASGVQINNKCEYVELLSFTNDPLWFTEDISENVHSFVNKERSTALGVSITKLAGFNLLVFLGLYFIGIILFRKRKD